MTREEFYWNLVYSSNAQDFERMFGEPPADIQDFDYNFESVHWTYGLEAAYQTYMDQRG